VSPHYLGEGGLVALARETRKLSVGRLFKLLGQCRISSVLAGSTRVRC
jgi:hypothetical protein